MALEIKKGWGKEVIFASNELYAGKLLCYDKAGNISSMHFHGKKDETFYILSGSVWIVTINPVDATEIGRKMVKGDLMRLKPLTIHQIQALEDDTVIIEVSTPDEPTDNYRVRPGDSQK